MRSDKNWKGVGVDMSNPLDIQVEGSHYKKMAIQPVEFIMLNNLDYCQGNVCKYVARFRDKNWIADLEKAKHYLDLLIMFEKDKGEYCA
jgi:hypothetical protein